MSKYCPRWVFEIVVTQACYDYVRLDSVAGAGLLVISHKYLSGLKKIYKDNDYPKIEEVATEILNICSSFKVDHKTENLLSDYLFFKFYYVNSKVKRKLTNLIYDSRFSNYPRYPTIEETVNSFNRFSYRWVKTRKIIYEKEWNLKSQDDFAELRKLANEPITDYGLNSIP
jgi:hypothetical protein